MLCIISQLNDKHKDSFNICQAMNFYKAHGPITVNACIHQLPNMIQYILEPSPRHFLHRAANDTQLLETGTQIKWVNGVSV